jgi:hypothetical protein
MALAAYRASSAFTITLASLATSSGLTVGRCSTSLSNGTNKDEHLAIAGQITASPTGAGDIEVWAFAQRKDSTWPDLFSSAYSGSDAGFTIRSRDILFAGAQLIATMRVASGTNVPYSFGPLDMVTLFGYPPKDFALFVTQSTGANLNATAGNHSIDLMAAYY